MQYGQQTLACFPLCLLLKLKVLEVLVQTLCKKTFLETLPKSHRRLFFESPNFRLWCEVMGDSDFRVCDESLIGDSFGWKRVCNERVIADSFWWPESAMTSHCRLWLGERVIADSFWWLESVMTSHCRFWLAKWVCNEFYCRLVREQKKLQQIFINAHVRDTND